MSSGKIYILGEDVTNYSPEKRAKYLSRVFQDPKMGTAPRMTVAGKPLGSEVSWRKTWFDSASPWPAIKKSFKQSLLRLAMAWKIISIQPLSFYQGNDKP